MDNGWSGTLLTPRSFADNRERDLRRQPMEFFRRDISQTYREQDWLGAGARYTIIGVCAGSVYRLDRLDDEFLISTAWTMNAIDVSQTASSRRGVACVTSRNTGVDTMAGVDRSIGKKPLDRKPKPALASTVRARMRGQGRPLGDSGIGAACLCAARRIVQPSSRILSLKARYFSLALR